MTYSSILRKDVVLMSDAMINPITMSNPNIWGFSCKYIGSVSSSKSFSINPSTPLVFIVPGKISSAWSYGVSGPIIVPAGYSVGILHAGSSAGTNGYATLSSDGTKLTFTMDDDAYSMSIYSIVFN